MIREVGIVIKQRIFRIALDVDEFDSVLPTIGIDLVSHALVVCDLDERKFIKNRLSDNLDVDDFEYYMFKHSSLCMLADMKKEIHFE